MESDQHLTTGEASDASGRGIDTLECIKTTNARNLTSPCDVTETTTNDRNTHENSIVQSEGTYITDIIPNAPIEPLVLESTILTEDFASKLDISECSDSTKEKSDIRDENTRNLMDTDDSVPPPLHISSSNPDPADLPKESSSWNRSNEDAALAVDSSTTPQSIADDPIAELPLAAEPDLSTHSTQSMQSTTEPDDTSSSSGLETSETASGSASNTLANITADDAEHAQHMSDTTPPNAPLSGGDVGESNEFVSADTSDKPAPSPPPSAPPSPSSPPSPQTVSDAADAKCVGAMGADQHVAISDEMEMELDADADADMEVESALFEHVNAENDDKEEEKDEEVAVTASSKGQDEDPIDCWPLNAEPKDILSICPEDNDECIIPDDEKEGDSVPSFPQAETKDHTEEEETIDAADKTANSSESSATPKDPEKSYDLTMDDIPTESRCIVCLLTKSARYHFSYQNEEKYICDEMCLNRFKENPTIGFEKVGTMESSTGGSPAARTDSEDPAALAVAGNALNVGNASGSTRINYLAGERGAAGVTAAGAGAHVPHTATSSDATLTRARDKAKARACADCMNPVLTDINSYSWEAMDFCSEACLARYQKQIGGFCQQCNIPVRNNVLGKYCVRFGSALRQFCSGSCLEMHKRDLRLCTYCQEDLGENSAVECDAGKKFCTSACMHNFASMTTNRLPVVPKESVCCVCSNRKTIEIIFERDGVPFMFCGNPCLVAYKFVNKVSPAKCGFCYKYVEHATLDEYTMFYEGKLRSFCSNICKNIYIIAHRKIVPCSWCKVKKYNFDMIRKTSARNQIFNICSLNCLKFFNTSLSVVSSRSRQVCDYCLKSYKPVYHLTMSDGSTRNFCTHQCVTDFQKKFERRQSDQPQPTNNRLNNNSNDNSTSSTVAVQNETPFSKQPMHQYHGKKGAKGRPSRKQVLPDRPGPLPIITSVCSLAPSAQTAGTAATASAGSANSEVGCDDDGRSRALGMSIPKPSEPVPQKTKRLLVVQRPNYIEQRNVMTTATPMILEKYTNFKPDQEEKDCQTDIPDEAIQLIPIPIPIYVPSPMFAYHMPLPTPVPFPLPIPVPVLIPITKHTAENVMKEIRQKVQVKGPTDPFEAELLMMAELVAAEKKDAADMSDDDGGDGADGGADGADDGYSPEPADSSGFGDDMLQMALKMASDFDQQAVDLEGALTASTITPQQQQQQQQTHGMAEGEESVVMGDESGAGGHMLVSGSGSSERGRGRRRGGAGTRQRSYGARRGRRSAAAGAAGVGVAGAQNQHQQMDMAAQMATPAEPPPPPEPVEKPDAHMCLKYTFGVNAWKQWVTTKNVELERSSRRLKPFKTELLQLTSDELNYSLCLFVKEVRKPNGSEYAPDTIYYLCLGIQQYLFENGRIDNIFCDSYYDKFTEVLDEVCKKFSALYNDSHYIVTRVEEEHLWESKQLGAHSPHVLLSTLMFFNTKHFNLTSVDEHMQLSFSHIMKHWKRNPNQPANATAAKTPGSRNVLLRFYPPQSALESNSRKKKVYEQQENEENPLRCPVKLYEFYLSKCPESVKTRNDVFYLMPERSCVPDSPVWYSTIAQERPALEKMLHRVKMVKEINVALLTT